MIHHRGSIETIMTYNKNEPGEWSVVWSTSHIPGMDNATGGGPRRAVGRRRLRLGALALGCCLAMHCRLAASILTGGTFLAIIFFVLSVVLVGNPLRHFEVYLGQWSLSGPGRAFRIIPMLDGIGIAVCINSIIRAICCCCIASITAFYVYHSISDKKLPFTYCRDFDMKPYDPIVKTRDILQVPKDTKLEHSWIATPADVFGTVGTRHHAWRKMTPSILVNSAEVIKRTKIKLCKEKYTGSYPTLYSTPAYNFFYIEVMHYHPDKEMNINFKLLAIVMCIWILIWLMLIYERLAHGKLIWNNLSPCLLVLPCVWLSVLIATVVFHYTAEPLSVVFNKVFLVDSKEFVFTIADTVIMAMYIHSASTGTELIHGKGLNHYASGHIDPNLNYENVVHSLVVLLLSTLQSASAAVCSILEYSAITEVQEIKESTLWLIPMYSRCAIIGDYSHLVSTILFTGLTISYITVAFVLIKTALHIIFEYRVKLVFIEQLVVGALMVTCMLLSVLFTIDGGLPLLESIDAVMTGISMPFVCTLELVGMLYMYRSHDFVSDMMIATEDNTCSTRISTQWQILPFVMIVCLLCKIAGVVEAEMHSIHMYAALAPLAGVLLAVPLRACHNAYVFLRPTPRRET